MLETVAATIVALALLMAAAGTPGAMRQRRLFNRRDGFSCSCCGNCCRFRTTPLTLEDVKRLQEAGLADFHLTQPEMRLKRVNGRCIFLSDDKCTVHDARPQVCRDFPFFREAGIGLAQGISFCPALERLEND